MMRTFSDVIPVGLPPTVPPAPRIFIKGSLSGELMFGMAVTQTVAGGDAVMLSVRGMQKMAQRPRSSLN